MPDNRLIVHTARVMQAIYARSDYSREELEFTAAIRRRTQILLYAAKRTIITVRTGSRATSALQLKRSGHIRDGEVSGRSGARE